MAHVKNVVSDTRAQSAARGPLSSLRSSMRPRTSALVIALMSLSCNGAHCCRGAARPRHSCEGQALPDALRGSSGTRLLRVFKLFWASRSPLTDLCRTRFLDQIFAGPSLHKYGGGLPAGSGEDTGN